MSNNTALEQLFCLQNNLESLDLSNNTELYWLSASLNSLPAIDVSANVALQGLFISHNEISELDLSNNLLLQELNASNNPSLTCITIDPFADVTDWVVDAGVGFSEDCSNIGYSGPRTITGQVISGVDGSPLPGVNILILGTSTGTVTNIDGEYSIFIPGNDAILTVSIVGYSTINETVGDRIRVDLVLWSDPESSSMSSSLVQGEITIYPNPVINTMTVSHADETIVLADMGITVYDNSGSMYPISTSFVDVAEGFELDLYELAPGNYILHITDDKTIEVFRIQKE